MQLSFRAKPGNVCHWPGLKANGQLCRYVGRDFVAGDADKGVAAAHPAAADPIVVDSESEDGRRLAKLCRRDDALWPADAATAAFCGKKFVNLIRDDAGEWVPGASAAAVAKPVSSASTFKPESE